MANNKTEVRRILDQAKADGRTSLTAPEGKLVCDAYGIPVPKEGVATTPAEAAKLAAGMGFPVVLKIVSPQILHKTEAGGVLVGVKSAAEVEQGFATIMANSRKYDAKATLMGIQVQQMLAGGLEVIVGSVTDPSFGKLVAFGLGGVLVEARTFSAWPRPTKMPVDSRRLPPPDPGVTRADPTALALIAVALISNFPKSPGWIPPGAKRRAKPATRARTSSARPRTAQPR